MFFGVTVFKLRHIDMRDGASFWSIDLVGEEASGRTRNIGAARRACNKALGIQRGFKVKVFDNGDGTRWESSLGLHILFRGDVRIARVTFIGVKLYSWKAGEHKGTAITSFFAKRLARLALGLSARTPRQRAIYQAYKKRPNVRAKERTYRQTPKAQSYSETYKRANSDIAWERELQRRFGVSREQYERMPVGARGAVHLRRYSVDFSTKILRRS